LESTFYNFKLQSTFISKTCIKFAFFSISLILSENFYLKHLHHFKIKKYFYQDNNFLCLLASITLLNWQIWKIFISNLNFVYNENQLYLENSVPSTIKLWSQPQPDIIRSQINLFVMMLKYLMEYSRSHLQYCRCCFIGSLWARPKLITLTEL